MSKLIKLIKLTTLTPLLAIASLAVMSRADAHTSLESSEPPDASVVSQPIESLSFTFTGQIEPFADGFTVVVDDGTDVGIESVDLISDRTVVVTLEEPLTGAITATWAIVADDTHPITGTIHFDIEETEVRGVPQSETSASETPPPTASAEPAQATQPPDQERAARSAPTVEPGLFRGVIGALGYAATAIVVGGFAVIAAADRRHRHHLWSVARAPLWVAVGVLTATTVLLVSAQLAVLSSEITAVARIGDWSTVFTGGLRIAVIVRLAGCALLAAALGVPTKWGILAAPGAVLVTVSFPLLGHTAEGASRWLAIPSAIVHVGAISVWMGGLVVVLLTAARRRNALASVARTFSTMAGAAVAAASLAGVCLVVVQLDQTGDLWQTPFGQRLLAKLALVALVVAIGALHRFRTVPRLADIDVELSAARPQEFVRLAQVEVVLFVLVLAVTAWMVTAAT